MVPFALALVLLGACALLYQRGGKRRFESALVVAGIALVASGIAVLRDDVEGSHMILWKAPAYEMSALPVERPVVNNGMLAALP